MYIPKRTARSFGQALDDGDPLATGIAVTIMIVFGGIVVSIPILATVECNEQKEGIKLLNAQIIKDINENTNHNIQDFSTEKIIIKDTESLFTIKITGKANDGEKQNNASSIQYKISADNFKALSERLHFDRHAENGVLDWEVNTYLGGDLSSIVEVIKQSEILSTEINNVNFLDNSEITVEVGKPEIEEDLGKISYNLALTKMEGNNLKMAWFKVCAKLDEKLIENPDKIYSMHKNDLKIEKIDEFTQSGVDYVYKQKNNFMAVPTL